MAMKRMLVDATHQEETRIVVVRGKDLEEFDFESASRVQLRGNIYLAKVTRVEPSLQAAFVEYGGNKHGFLAFSEIHPDYYQIPVADREALLLAEKQQISELDDDISEDSQASKNTNESQKDSVSKEGTDKESSGDEADLEEDDEKIEQLGGEDPLEENGKERKKAPFKRYKIQEVIKRRQVMLVQVVKEERGNKGAALTSYLSLAGRYSVLMPNTARGGGISRKITSASDRKRLKEIANSLSVPEGMGIILRTAGASRTKVDIKRDFEYLMRLWENVRSLTLSTTAPCLVYEEGSLIKRTIRDLYSKEIDELLVSGETAHSEAKDFMAMIMPSHIKRVKLYKGAQPIFSKYNIEQQLDSMFSPQVTLPSGGYIVINPTEALVSIDVNSGRATKERNIEATALQTNLEAAQEVARQLRLRDMAGLVVIDFIDMIDKKSIRSVERKLKDALKDDRARIQVGRISHFGLLEMSRQRMRFGVLESSTNECPTCQGAGIVRSVESLALKIVRAIEDHVQRKPGNSISVKTPSDVANYILNAKRDSLSSLEKINDISISVFADNLMIGNNFEIEKGEKRENSSKPVTHTHVKVDSADIVNIEIDEDEDLQEDTKRPQRSNNGRNRNKGKKDEHENHRQQDVSKSDGSDDVEISEEVKDSETSKEEPRKKRRRGRRGGRRNKFTANEQESGENVTNAQSDETLAPADEVGMVTKSIDQKPPQQAKSDKEQEKKEKPKRTKSKKTKEAPVEQGAANVTKKDKAKPVQKSSETNKEKPKKTVKAKPESKKQKDEIVVTSNKTEEKTKTDTKKGGWWQRNIFG